MSPKIVLSGDFYIPEAQKCFLSLNINTIFFVKALGIFILFLSSESGFFSITVPKKYLVNIFGQK